MGADGKRRACPPFSPRCCERRYRQVPRRAVGLAVAGAQLIPLRAEGEAGGIPHPQPLPAPLLHDLKTVVLTIMRKPVPVPPPQIFTATPHFGHSSTAVSSSRIHNSPHGAHPRRYICKGVLVDVWLQSQLHALHPSALRRRLCYSHVRLSLCLTASPLPCPSPPLVTAAWQSAHFPLSCLPLSPSSSLPLPTLPHGTHIPTATATQHVHAQWLRPSLCVSLSVSPFLFSVRLQLTPLHPTPFPSLTPGRGCRRRERPRRSGCWARPTLTTQTSTLPT